MYVWSYSQKSYLSPCKSICAAKAGLVRSLCDDCYRCGGCGICIGRIAGSCGTYFVGAGLSVAKGIGASLFAGDRGHAPYHSGHSQPPTRCVMGDGRGATVQDPCLCRRRTLGRSQSVEFHSHQTIGTAIRSGWNTLLAVATQRQCRPQRGPRTVAHFITAFSPTSRRCASTGGSTLESRIISLAQRFRGRVGCTI